MRRVTLYGKAGCCLCDEAKADGRRGTRRYAHSSSRRSTCRSTPALNHEYGERIPVVAVDGEELFEYHVYPAELRTALDTVAS